MKLNNTNFRHSLLTIFLFLSLSVIVFFCFYHFFIKNTFEVTKQVPCDPAVDSCFVSDCDTNDSTCDTTTTYKKIKAPSKYAGSNYENFTCEAGNPNCEIITCNDSTVEDGEKCFK
ncbi:MAG: hypothetical protein WCI41_00190 [bacterium]